MRRLDWHQVFRLAAVLMPVVCVVALGLVFLLDRVPRIVENEKARVEGEYLKLSESLRSGARQADFVWTRHANESAGRFSLPPKDLALFPSNLTWKAWAEHSSESGKEVRSDERDGYLKLPDGRVAVWGRTLKPSGKAGDVLKGAVVEAVETYDYRRMFWSLAVFVLVVLVGVTVWGLRYFVGYARARDDFLAATAHDLTTPLVGLRYVIGRDDEEARHLNERMLRLVQNIRDFLRLGGRRAPDLETVDLRAAFAEAYRVFAADYAEEASGPVSVEGPDRLDARCDETMTVQILWNLLGNDLKYAAPYGRVRVRFRENDGRAEVVLSDEGPGMEPKARRRAFDRYYRAKTVLESGKGGFGIGLCTAREFARAMGGDLTLEPNEPHGCIFTLALPRAHQ